MKNIKRAAAITMVASGLALAGAGVASAHGPQAGGQAVHSPGIVSGNNTQVPVNVATNVCGNSLHIVGILNPNFGERCVNN
ncbi:chaplin [Streptomyces sp. NPDC059008]|uniref:chaplin n=1 Tax=unclassified Streptomyces TaxID=2593676 RepID=UPI0036AF8838